MKYDLEYFDEMLRRNSGTAKRISKIRWKFINRVDPKLVLDYGSGVGWFTAFKPEGVTVDTYDIGEYPQTGIQHSYYDVVCFWDVLEHIHSMKEIESILTKTRNIALTTPIKPKKQNLKTWKHFKPGEHLNYFTGESLNETFEKYDFVFLTGGYLECPPRKDIFSALYTKMRKVILE